MGCNQFNPCDNGGRRDGVGNHADQLARALDSGRTDAVVNALQQDAYSLSPNTFKRVIQETDARESKRHGDNLELRRNGDVVLDTGDRRFTVANIYQQERSWEDRQRQVYQGGQYYEGRDGRYQGRNDGYYDNRGGYDPRFDPRGRQGGYDPRYDRGGYDPRYDQGGYDRGGYYGRRNQTGEIIEDVVRGAITGQASGGNAVKGAIVNGALGAILRGGRW